MKKVHLILVLMFSTIACKAQVNITDYSNVYVNSISIAGFSPSDFTRTIGTPSLMYVDDMGFYVDVYKKNENLFSFYKSHIEEKYENYSVGDLISFDIMDSSITVKVNTTSFKVGDTISAIKSAFPESYTQGKRNSQLVIGLRGDMNGGSWISDDKILIRYNKHTQKIIDIHLYYAL